MIRDRKTGKKWLVEYFQESPVLIMRLTDTKVIEIVENCLPYYSGTCCSRTIRGDFSHDSIDLANDACRPLRNVIHASDTIEYGEKEVALWFKPEELFAYTRADEKIMFP
jgi:nucleoside-diphosphate kinase